MSDARIRDLESQLAAANKRIAEDAKRAAIGMALARAQVKNPNAVYDAIAAQVIQSHDGTWVAEENGVSKFGPDEGCTYSLDRLVADVAGKSNANIPSQAERGGQVNPFVRGPNFNVTAQMILTRSDPELAEHFQYLASIGK